MSTISKDIREASRDKLEEEVVLLRKRVTDLQLLSTRQLEDLRFHRGALDPHDIIRVGIRYLVETSHEMAKSKGWYDDGPRPMPEVIALFHSELSEALEELRNGHAPAEVYEGANGKPEGVPVELADVLIRIADTCGAEGIDLGQAIVAKMKFNATRPVRHGGKKL